VASLGALASEVTALYGLRQNKMDSAKPAAAARAAAPTPATLALTDDVNQQQVKLSFDQFYSLRTQALSGRVTRALEGGLSATFAGDWTELADAPSIWPLEGRVTSSFGERIPSTEKAPSTPESTFPHPTGRPCAQRQTAK
jgi:hypothetical protein